MFTRGMRNTRCNIAHHSCLFQQSWQTSESVMVPFPRTLINTTLLAAIVKLSVLTDKTCTAFLHLAPLVFPSWENSSHHCSQRWHHGETSGPLALALFSQAQLTGNENLARVELVFGKSIQCTSWAGLLLPVLTHQVTSLPFPRACPALPPALPFTLPSYVPISNEW